MKASELRVGNLIRFISTQDIEEVLDIRTAGIKTPVINNVCISDVEPIPLTEDWLERFGFRKETETDYVKDVWEAKAIFYSHHEDFIFDKIILDNDGSWVLVTAERDHNHNVQHVHQLQNLYYALTGKELLKK